VESDGGIPGLRYKVGLGLPLMSFEHKREGDQHATAPMEFSLSYVAIEKLAIAKAESICTLARFLISKPKPLSRSISFPPCWCTGTSEPGWIGQCRVELSGYQRAVRDLKSVSAFNACASFPVSKTTGEPGIPVGTGR
jgi:hypothetical protein